MIDWNKQIDIHNSVFNRKRKTDAKDSRKIILYSIRKTYTGLNIGEICKNIKQNQIPTKNNIHDNDIVIRYLNGDSDSIWILYEKYKIKYLTYLRYNKNLYERQGYSFKEPAELVLDFFMEMIKKIKFGGYLGFNFRGFSYSFLRIYLLSNTRKNKLTVRLL